jgi:hypothetical protein
MKRLVPVALVAALAVTGVAVGVRVSGADSQPGSAPVAVAPAPEPAISTPPVPTASATVQPERDEPPGPAVDPRTPKQLRLWKFDAPVIPVDLNSGTLDPPSDPKVLGWWGQPAGSTQGTTLLVGHTVSTGGGTLDDLEHTKVGKVAKVSGVKYRVERVTIISKAQLAKRAPKLFDQTGTAKLVIVTCEGYDSVTRTYADNVVVVAKPV